MSKIQYYLIHGPDSSRAPRMIEEFEKWGLDNKQVKWLLHPNGNEIPYELRRQLVCQTPSYTCGTYVNAGCPNMGNGKVSCTFKHYLCLKDIVENGYDYGVIMEDNQYFNANIPETVSKYIHQLNELYPEKWDIIFDTNWQSYKNVREHPVNPGVFVYPKSNEISEHGGHGGTRLAQFYILTHRCAKLLFENYLPFNNAPDWWMNDLFRKLRVRSFWSEPSISSVFPHTSTAW